MTEPLYMLKVVCAVGCGRDAIGPCRPADEGEFPTAAVERFRRQVVESGWTRYEFEDGPRFLCHAPGCKPWAESIAQELREHYVCDSRHPRGALEVNPSFFSTISITNEGQD